MVRWCVPYGVAGCWGVQLLIRVVCHRVSVAVLATRLQRSYILGYVMMAVVIGVLQQCERRSTQTARRGCTLISRCCTKTLLLA